MKKKITSKKDLNSMALSSGAMVTDSSGKKFNSKKKTAYKLPPEPAPEKRLEPTEPKPKPAYVAPPKPDPIKPDENLLVVANKIDDMSKTNAVLMAQLMKEISRLSFSAAMPVMEWDFNFTRDNKGYLTNIHATAIEQKPTLN